MPRSELQFSTGALVHTQDGMPDYVLIWMLYRTVPTKDQVLVPETLLKKRKSQEKARAERSAEIEKRKKVSAPPLLPVHDNVM